ncbi:MAG: GDSL-type esterase/lipase family protein [Desulfobulbaceae bacterium]|nr:GDSL-type esterase/lipase family protein [Desulfobulbaceae bacterium]
METVLLLGDSLIEYGDWELLLPGYRTSNRGLAGETAGGLAARLIDEVNSMEDPDQIVVLSGTNDLLMGDHTFPEVFTTMLPRLRNFCADAGIIVVGLAPIPMVWDSAQQINTRLEQIAQASGCRFLDLFDPFALQCRPAGNPCFLMDGVHFSPHGYRVLAAALADALQTGA